MTDSKRQRSQTKKAVPAAEPENPGEAAVRFAAEAHLEATALSSGDGPRIEGSARVRRLARAATAPPDTNGNGSNLDETWAAELDALVRLAGATEVPPLGFAIAPPAIPFCGGMPGRCGLDGCAPGRAR